MSESAKRGREIFFTDKGSCTACHVGPNLTDEQYHNLGVGMDAEKPDLGRHDVTKEEKDKGAFKTPTIRNVELSAPYMHDGSHKTLEEVVDWYDKGGHPNPTLDPKIKKLNLTEQDKKDLVEFMKACTGDLPEGRARAFAEVAPAVFAAAATAAIVPHSWCIVRRLAWFAQRSLDVCRGRRVPVVCRVADPTLVMAAARVPRKFPCRLHRAIAACPPSEDELYQEHILEHYEDPYHRGHVPHATHAHEDDNPLCGDVVGIDLSIDPAGPDRGNLFRWRWLLHQPGRGLDAGRTLRSAYGRRGEAILGRGHAAAVRRQADAQSAEVLPALLAGVAGRDLLAAVEEWSADRGMGIRPRRKRTRTPHEHVRRRHCRLILTTLRADFPILSVRLHDDVPLVYLDNAATTQRPRQVIQSLVDVYEKQYANVHRGIHWLSDQSTDLFEEAREKVRAFINAPAARASDLHPRHDRGDQPGRPQLGRGEHSRRAMKSCSQRWSIIRTSFPGSSWPRARRRAAAHSGDAGRPAWIWLRCPRY